MTRSEIGSMWLGPSDNIKERYERILSYLLNDVACDNYRSFRLGGPCLVCGRSQPEHQINRDSLS